MVRIKSLLIALRGLSATWRKPLGICHTMGAVNKKPLCAMVCVICDWSIHDSQVIEWTPNWQKLPAISSSMSRDGPQDSPG